LKKIWFLLSAGVVVLILTGVGYTSFFKAAYNEDVSTYKDASTQFMKHAEKGDISNLPGVSEQDSEEKMRELLFLEFIPKLIKTSLIVFGVVMMIIMVISGIYLVSGGLDESLIAAAKTSFYYSIIGAVIVTISYALVYGVTKIDWFG